MFLNRIVAACDTCNISELEGTEFDYMNGNFWQINQPQFLTRSVQVTAENDWIFGEESQFTIKPHASIGEQWLYSEEQNITAAISYYGSSEVLGITDSVKTILLNTGEVIVLSKNHGIRKFPDWNSGESYELSGIEGRDMGELLPRFEDIYDFSVGDIVQDRNRTISLEESGNTIYSDVITNRRRTIIELETYTDSVIVTYDVIQNDSIFDTNTALHTINEISSYEITSKYYRGFYDQTNKIPWSLTYTNNYDPQVCTYYIDPTGRTIQSFSGYKFINSESDHTYFEEINDTFLDFGFEPTSLILGGESDIVTQNIWGYDFKNFAYSACLGRISGQVFYSNYHSQGLTSWGSGDYFITAFQKANGETEGELIPEDVLLSTSEIESQVDFNVFPNPAKDLIHISGEQNLKSLSISTLLGKEMFNQKASGKVASVSLEELASGTYILEIETEDAQRFSQRFFKE